MKRGPNQKIERLPANRRDGGMTTSRILFYPRHPIIHVA